jgi:hypothetical protein
MMMSASPGEAAAMVALVPAAVERSQLRGFDNRSPNSAALTSGEWGAARSA